MRQLEEEEKKGTPNGVNLSAHCFKLDKRHICMWITEQNPKKKGETKKKRKPFSIVFVSRTWEMIAEAARFCAVVRLLALLTNNAKKKTTCAVLTKRKKKYSSGSFEMTSQNAFRSAVELPFCQRCHGVIAE